MNWYETPSFVTLAAECTGEHALGMQSGRITRQQLSASSQWDKYHAPDNARLNFIAGRGKKGSWSSRTEDLNQWFQVDFLRNVKLTKFATQGRQDERQWVTKFKLRYSAGGSRPAFQTYQEVSGVDKIFNGNTDHTSVVTHTLAAPITARYVEIKPIEWYEHISMRTEFYGCVLSDRYQVIGRNVHMEFVEEHLRAKKGLYLDDTQDSPNNINLEVLADTIYVKERSKLDLRAPALSQTDPTLSAGEDGNDGKHGVDGPTGALRSFIFCYD
ncbi:retinoschisin-like [Exaiptasia diaphana]|uniref:F5/8 type C domain-containing protein n=1 Tax=Exaiptasia diaphana TaxID=2652724 RepID=A0A913YQS2_EXADI|nr:retinoschisin-like [Exaiptasia diaphana]